MYIRINYDEEAVKGKITTSNDIPAFVWNRIKDLAIAAEPDAVVIKQSILSDWLTILSMAPGLSGLRQQYGFEVEYGDKARLYLSKYQAEVRAVRLASGMQTNVVPESEIQHSLHSIGFTKRQLTPEQLRDTSRMMALANAANFSVPGAGKTTVALAAHLLTKQDDTFLLVVAPKNAFAAWDEVLLDCLDTSCDATRFVRLSGTNKGIQNLLAQSPHRLIISYDKLIRASEIISRFLSTHKVHLILDESHRMKSGDRSQRGTVLLSLAHLPVRKDILSGTPIPRSIDDIRPQIDFLWPGQGLGLRVVAASSPQEILRQLYVRTTKHELGLPPVSTRFVPVSMSPAQLALYALLRSHALQRMRGIRTGGNVDLVAARRSIMRLLQASSNPILLVRRLTNEEPDGYEFDDPDIRAIFTSILEENDSPKIIEACRLARSLVDEGNHVVIWSSFKENVERIAHLLHDLGAVYIHGDIETGSEDDLNTREGKIRQFHSTLSGCKVLVANPAACSEGISLHRICHHAIYMDRTFNAAHYLQSRDRIHRLGLPANVSTYIYILESVAPGQIGAVDYSVRRRLIEKLHIMAQALEDTDLIRLALDEEEGELPLDYDIDLDDIRDVMDELLGSAPAPDEED